MAEVDPRYFDDDPDGGPPTAARVGKTAPRRRKRFGSLVNGLGDAGRARMKPEDVNTIVQRRERAEQAKLIERSGHNKGEKKGYGATAGRPVPPP